MTLSAIGIMMVAFAIGWAIASRWMRGRQWYRFPRQQRRHKRRIALFWSVPLCVFAIAVQVMTGQVSILTYYIVAVVVWILLSLILQPPEQFGPAEALANYARDPAHCGQCEYDLTANTSGICPECGWEIPAQPPPANAYIPWGMWWKRWRIEQLPNWPKTLALLVVGLLVFAGLALGMAIQKVPSWPIMVVIGATYLIHIWRVTAYGLRQRRGQAGPAREMAGEPAEER